MVRNATFAAAFAAFVISSPAGRADVPRVAADILPVHGLVARVMEGVGAPELVLPPGASPHGHAMRPSEARALDAAEIVFWVGPELTLWLEGPLRTLAADARIVTLLDAPGTHLLPFRAEGMFGADDGEDGHDHAETDDSDHGHGHAHGDIDPHAWLDPQNARAWLDVIAGALAEADPARGARYRANAADGAAEIAAVAEALEDRLAPVRARSFVAFHDATQYFERQFGLVSDGALSLSDGAAPGPARLAAIRAHIAEHDVACLVAEPHANRALAAAVLEGHAAQLVILDPIGAGIPRGPDFYPSLLAALGAAFASCG